MSVVTLNPIQYRTVDQGQPNDNIGSIQGYEAAAGQVMFGTNTVTLENYPWTTGYCNAWLQFSLSTLPTNISVSSVKLKINNVPMYTSSVYTGSDFVVYAGAGINWTQSNITWNTAPNDSLNVVSSGGWNWPYDEQINWPSVSCPLYYDLLTSEIEGAISSGTITYRIGNDGGNFWSINGSNNEIQLEITYIEILEAVVTNGLKIDNNKTNKMIIGSNNITNKLLLRNI